MLRSSGSAVLSFGLVSLPVKLYAAAETAEVSLRQLHAKCGKPINLQQVCRACGVELKRDDVIKGHEYTKGQYVTFTADELAALEAEKTSALEVGEFVPADSVDVVYFEKTTYLAPEKGSEKSYSLLALALNRTGLVGLGQYTSRGKQHLVLLRPVGLGLSMHTLHYASAVRGFEQVPCKNVACTESEIALAVELVQKMAAPRAELEKYQDARQARLLEVIDAKVQGHAVEYRTETLRGQAVDLMEAIRESINKG